MATVVSEVVREEDVMREYFPRRYYGAQVREILGNDKRKKNVSKGEVILTSTPFAYVLSSSLRGIYCSHCLKKKTSSALQRCSRCKFEFYCNEDCQRGAWAVHRHECLPIKNQLPRTVPDTARLMARIIFRLKNGGDREEEKTLGNKTRKFKDLMNHYKDIKTDRRRHEHFESLVVVLRSFLGEDNLPNEVELQGIFGRICVNSFSLMDPEMNSVGTAVYLAASVFDHSCDPNAFVSFEGPRLTCRALRDLPDLDLSRVRISYLDVLAPTMDRLEDLHRRYYFWCDCPRCNDPQRDRQASSVVCGKAGCGGPVPVDEDGDPGAGLEPCLSCGDTSLGPDIRAAYCAAAAFCQEQLDLCQDQYFLDVCQRALERQGQLFHRTNLLRVKILDAAFESSISVNNWHCAIEYGSQNLAGLRFYYGDDHPNIGLTLLKLGKILVLVGRVQEGLGYLEEARTILEAFHGPSHPMVVEQLQPLLAQALEELRNPPTPIKRNTGRHVLVRTTCG